MDRVFVEGWTTDSAAENWVARWESPIDARFVRISALPNLVFGHDANVQIDAVIAAVPAPGAALLAMIGFPLIGWAKRRFG